MTVLHAYLWVSTILFVFLGTVWTRNIWVNVVIKVLFWALALVGFLLVSPSIGITLINGQHWGIV